MKRVIYKIEDWIRSVKFAYQRVVRGYDDTAYWSLDTYLAEMLVPIMTWYRDNDPHMMSKDFGVEEYFTREEQVEVYNKMITAFQSMIDYDHLIEDYTPELQDKVDEGLQLFAKYFRGFWT